MPTAERSFSRDTAVGPDGACEIADGWSAPVGPNGGYVAAIVLRAMTAALDDADRAPRSLTCHYLRPPQPGPAVVETTVERSGRSVSTVSARLVQDGRLCTLGLGAFSVAHEGFEHEWSMAPPTGVPLPEDMPPHERSGRAPAIADRFDLRWAIGSPPFSGGPEALAGGWLRLAEERPPVDAPLAALFTDAWLPPIYSRLTRPVPVPTVDLTIHFRTALPLQDTDPDDFVLAVFRSRHAQEGFVEEDGEVWTRDGRLLAISRQLALLR